MTVVTSERCFCGEPFAVEIQDFREHEYLRVHDLAPIEVCEGCGRDLAAVEEERMDQWYEHLESRYGEDPYGVECGGVRYGGES